MHARVLAAAFAVLAVLAALAPAPTAGPAHATAAGPTGVTPVWPGLNLEHWSFAAGDGAPVVANVLLFSADDEHLHLEPVLAQSRVPGLETVPSMGRRLLPHGAVAGINGGFWLNNPVGDPNGYLALGGQLVSDAESQGAGPRGTFALRADGRPLIERLGTSIAVYVNGITASGNEGVRGVNRGWREGDGTLLYSPAFGTSVTLPGPAADGSPAARVVEVAGLTIPSEGLSGEGTVRRVYDVGTEPLAIPPDAVLIAGLGGDARQFAETAEGDRVFLRVEVLTEDTDVALDWRDLASGLAAGPMIVKDGQPTDPAGWTAEGFFEPTHSSRRHPRTAVGFTADNRIMLVTVDGRQDESAGMTMHELAAFMIRLGAVAALSLDGGGSTQMVVDGVIRNRPSESPRSVAGGLFVFHAHQFTATDRLAGSGREATAAAVARASHPQGAAEVVLAPSATFPDALAGGPLATALGAPLLLAGQDRLADATWAALAELGPQRVTILGGVAAIGAEVEASLRARYPVVRRVAGADRTETAAAIARVLGGAHPRVFLASAGGFADALTAAAPAGILRAPILLTGQDRLAGAARDVLRSSRVGEVVVVGGGAAVSAAVEAEVRALIPGVTISRLAGPNRYATARAVNEWAASQIGDLDQSGLVVARGDLFPDALSGGPLTAARRQLLMIVPSADVNAQPDVAAYLEARAQGPIARVTLLGGHGVLSSYQQLQLDQLANR